KGLGAGLHAQRRSGATRRTPRCMGSARGPRRRRSSLRGRHPENTPRNPHLSAGSRQRPRCEAVSMTGQTTEHTTGHTSALDLLAPEHRGLFIGGAWRGAEGGGRLDVIDPADGSVLTDGGGPPPAGAGGAP